MNKVLALSMALLSAPAMASESTLTSSSSTVTPVTIDLSYYTYDPKPDITAPELSEIFKIMLPALACRNIMGCDIKDAIKAAPENVKRHFVYHEH